MIKIGNRKGAVSHNSKVAKKMDKPLINVKHSVGVILLDDSTPSAETVSKVLDEILRAVAPRNRKVVEKVKSDLLKSTNHVSEEK